MSVDKTNLTVLGQEVQYPTAYNPDILQIVPRRLVENNLRVYAQDVWNAYEVSWLDAHHMPQIAVAKIIFDGHSEFIVESKSLKLYLNSFNNHVFSDYQMMINTIQQDLSSLVKGHVEINFELPPFSNIVSAHTQDWQCIDESISIKPEQQVNSDWLEVSSDEIINVKLYSHLLKSNCLVTHQPDWGTVFIQYHGPAINTQGLLKYIISYRHHSGFHEQCVERIFNDITTRLQPKDLMVQACYTRRGGLDINPIRSSRSDWIGIHGRGYRQ